MNVKQILDSGKTIKRTYSYAGCIIDQVVLKSGDEYIFKETIKGNDGERVMETKEKYVTRIVNMMKDGDAYLNPSIYQIN